MGADEGADEGAKDGADVGWQVFLLPLTAMAAFRPVGVHEPAPFVAVARKTRVESAGAHSETATLKRKYARFLGARSIDVQTRASSLTAGVRLASCILGAA